MYHKAYGIIETLAPLHVGATAGEETGNLNLIFRDQFTQTGIIPGSSIRGRFRADMRQIGQQWLESKLQAAGVSIPTLYVQEIEVQVNGKKKTIPRLEWIKQQAEEKKVKIPNNIDHNHWYGHEAVSGQENGGTTEALVKFEYASILWLPVYCPGQPIVRVSCPSLLKRYQKLAGLTPHQFEPYSYFNFSKQPYERPRLFFNLGSLPLKTKDDTLENYLPKEIEDREDYLVLVVKDREMAIIHEMALYRQSRVSLKDDEKVVDGKAFFNVEALPEKTVLIFPLALKKVSDNVWEDFTQAAKIKSGKELYLGGLESIGFGRCLVNLKNSPENKPK